MSIKKVLKNKF